MRRYKKPKFHRIARRVLQHARPFIELVKVLGAGGTLLMVWRLW